MLRARRKCHLQYMRNFKYKIQGQAVIIRQHDVTEVQITSGTYRKIKLPPIYP